MEDYIQTCTNLSYSILNLSLNSVIFKSQAKTLAVRVKWTVDNFSTLPNEQTAVSLRLSVFLEMLYEIKDFLETLQKCSVAFETRVDSYEKLDFLFDKWNSALVKTAADSQIHPPENLFDTTRDAQDLSQDLIYILKHILSIQEKVEKLFDSFGTVMIAVKERLELQESTSAILSSDLVSLCNKFSQIRISRFGSMGGDVQTDLGSTEPPKLEIQLYPPPTKHFPILTIERFKTELPDICNRVYHTLGGKQSEGAYQRALAVELKLHSISVKMELEIPSRKH